MTADEYDTGEESSPINRTQSGEPIVVGGDEGDRTVPAGASSEGFDADRTRGIAEDDLSDADHWACVFGTADETPNFSRSGAMCHD
jgi:hypothetical protein